MTAGETQITLTLPADIAEQLSKEGDLPRAALEGLALEAYRESRITTGQLQRLLGYDTQLQVHAFLKAHGVFLHYGWEDLEEDRKNSDRLDPRKE